MWYIMAGKLMSYLTFISLFNLLNNLNDFKTFNCTICWFFIEHIYEEYGFTSGKFFFISDDFRTLVKNCLLILRNFTFLAQAFNPLEFIFINILLISTLIFYKRKTLKRYVQFGVFVCYYYVFQSFLLCNSYILFFIFKNVLPIIYIINIIFIYLYIIFFFLTSNYDLQKKFFYILKLFFYCIFINYWVVFCLKNIIFELNFCGNFIQEFSFNISIAYSIFYLFI